MVAGLFLTNYGGWWLVCSPKKYTGLVGAETGWSINVQLFKVELISVFEQLINFRKIIHSGCWQDLLANGWKSFQGFC